MTSSCPPPSRCQQTAVLLAAGVVAVLVSGWLVSTLRTAAGAGELAVGLAVTGLVVAAQLRYLRVIQRDWLALSRSERRRTAVDAVVVPLFVPFLVPLAILAALVEAASWVRSFVHRHPDGRREPVSGAPSVPAQRRYSPTSTVDVASGDVTVGDVTVG